MKMTKPLCLSFVTISGTNSLDDYLQVVNKHVMDEPGAVECFAALQNLFRDNAFFGELLPDVAVAFVRMVDTFTEMGFFDLVPDYPYYYG